MLGQLDGLGTLTSRPARRVGGVPTESGSVSAGSWEVRSRERIEPAPGRRTVHFSVVLVFAAIFGSSRSASVSLARRTGCGLRIMTGKSSGRWERPITFGWTGAPPTFVRGAGFGRNPERVQGGWNANRVRARRPRVIGWTLSSWLFDRSILETAKTLQQRHRFVGCWAGSVGRWDLGTRGWTVTFGWQAALGSSSSVGQRTRWIRFLEVDSPYWERCRGHEPREDVWKPSSPSRLGGEQTVDGMSILEGECKATRGINLARNGPGK